MYTHIYMVYVYTYLYGICIHTLPCGTEDVSNIFIQIHVCAKEERDNADIMRSFAKHGHFC